MPAAGLASQRAARIAALSGAPSETVAHTAAAAGGYSAGGSRGPREMFEATCSSCGKEAQVPFQPSGDKPVYCSSCFEQRRGASSGGRYGSGGGRSRY